MKLFIKLFFITIIILSSLEVKAQQDKGFKAYNKGNYELAYKEWLRLHRNDENRQAQYNIGLLYRNGQGVKKDNKFAFDWFLRAANQNHPGALRFIGLMHMEGNGNLSTTVGSQISAFNYFSKALKQGDTLSGLYIGNMYKEGKGGVTKNLDTAKGYY